jgi:hypothetical protein
MSEPETSNTGGNRWPQTDNLSNASRGRCPTCGGTKEEPRRRYDETKWWQATPLPDCTDPFHGKDEG